MTNHIIEVRGLQKSYGKNHVLRGIDFTMERGTMLALLGPNGAGKTTTVRILSTLLPFDGGTITVDGHDLGRDPEAIRRIIGLTGQSAAVDELLTGRENLVMMGRLYRLTTGSAKLRARELLEQFDLGESADRVVSTYSGGMRRRLDLAVSLIATPPVIFLDEPTTGLDPRSRIAMWDIIKRLMEQGISILLTTQYLEEADQLADRIIVIDDGRVIAEGTAAELKSQVGRDRLELTFADEATTKQALKLLGSASAVKQTDDTTLSMEIGDVTTDVNHTLTTLAGAGIKVSELAVHKPTLDDVFLSLTGKAKVTETEKKPEKVK
ncbi:MAG TPA: ATP-binding cassette domain-containing protein [Candidatus Saccharimonadia bacterium]|nr:ATP-binding cassette domain-containing protein [Candidatus Saccharimonadia bacterium]